MPESPDQIALDAVEDVTDIEPEPTLAIGPEGHYFGPLGDEGKRLMKDLLETERAVENDEPLGQRMLDRIGIDYDHRRWRDYDLYWSQGSRDEVVEALRSWHTAVITRS